MDHKKIGVTHGKVMVSKTERFVNVRTPCLRRYVGLGRWLVGQRKPEELMSTKRKRSLRMLIRWISELFRKKPIYGYAKYREDSWKRGQAIYEETNSRQDELLSRKPRVIEEEEIIDVSTN